MPTEIYGCLGLLHLLAKARLCVLVPDAAELREELATAAHAALGERPTPALLAMMLRSAEHDLVLDLLGV